MSTRITQFILVFPSTENAYSNSAKYIQDAQLLLRWPHGEIANRTKRLQRVVGCVVQVECLYSRTALELVSANFGHNC